MARTSGPSALGGTCSWRECSGLPCLHVAHVVCSVFVLWLTRGWLARYGAIKLKKYLFTKAKEDYVLAEVASAKKGVHAKWKAIRDEYQTADTLEQVFNELVGVMVEEVASESHFDGLAGKERGEEEAGFVMAEPHVQYVVYRTVFGLWNKRKADLKQRVRLWLHGDAGADERGIESDSSDENDPPGFSVVSLDEDEASVPSGAESAASGDEFDNLLEAESSEDEVEDDWVLRQAKEEWLARGFALEDFSQDMLNRVRVHRCPFRLISCTPRRSQRVRSLRWCHRSSARRQSSYFRSAASRSVSGVPWHRRSERHGSSCGRSVACTCWSDGL